MFIFLLSNANAIALFLERHVSVSKVVYPGLKSHPQHEIATRQQNGYGAMITFYCVGGREQAAIILQNVSHTVVSTSTCFVEASTNIEFLLIVHSYVYSH